MGCLRAGLVAAVAVSGCGRGSFDPQPMLVFVDDDQVDFDGGVYDAGDASLAYADGRVGLAGVAPFDVTRSGMFVSRSFDTGDDEARWDSLAWTPIAPHGRPLPDGAANEIAYAIDNVSMADSILLLHFDGSGSLPHGAPIVDLSGRTHDGQIVIDGPAAAAAHVRGAFRDALAIDRDAYVTLDGRYFDFGAGDFTYAVWVQMFDCSQSNDNRIALGGAGAGDSPHMWLGALCPDSCPDLDGAFMNFLDSSRMGPSLASCTGVVLEDGTWHHLAGVKQGHTAPPAVVGLFVDGREVAAESFDFGDGTFTYDNGEIRLGSFNLGDPQYHTRIVVDEAAIWTRALDETEIASIYRRGAVRLELQIRVCPDRTCDDEPFVGPDGTGNTVFDEAALVGAPGSQRDNLTPLDLVGAVAQYRARFTTAAATHSPGLVSVRLEATAP